VRVSDGHVATGATARIVALSREAAVDLLRARTAAALASTSAPGTFFTLADNKLKEVHRQIVLGHINNAIEALVEYRDIIEFGAVAEYGMDSGVAAGLEAWSARIQGTFTA
jgi:hypothetical protein